MNIQTNNSTKHYSNYSIRKVLGMCLVSLLVFTFNLGEISNTYAANYSNSQRQAFDPKLKAVLKEAITKADSCEDKYDATVWLADMSNRLSFKVKDPEERLRILTTVHREAKRAGIQPELVLAVMEVESAFDRYAISRVGARGLMQIMPFWLEAINEEIGEDIGSQKDNLFHIETNIRFGCTILKYYMDIEKGNLFRALGRYNGSLGRAKYPNKVYRAIERRWYVQ